MNLFRYSVLFFLLFFLTGCQPLLPVKIINEIDVIEGAGYDLTEENKIKSYFIYPIYKGASEPPTTKSVSGIGDSSKESREEANHKTRYQLLSGQIRLILFGKTIAEKGIISLLDTYNRDPSIGRVTQLAIVEGSVSEVLDKKYEEVDNIALHLENLLDQNINTGLFPRTDFNRFMYQYYKEGIDPYLPVIKANGNDISISSLSIMKDDKLVYQLPKKDFFIFRSLVEKQEGGFYKAVFDDDTTLSVEVIRSKPVYDVVVKNGEPTLSVKVKINARVLEYYSSKGNALSKDLKKLEKKIETQLEAEGTDIINQFCKLNVDPLGFGAKHEARVRDFNIKKWNDSYPQSKVNLQVEVKLVETGIIQ